MLSKSCSVEEETVLQNPGSLFRVGFLVSGLAQSVIGFWVSSSSHGFLHEMGEGFMQNSSIYIFWLLFLLVEFVVFAFHGICYLY